MNKKKGVMETNEQYVYPPLPPPPPPYLSPKRIIKALLKKLLTWIENE